MNLKNKEFTSSMQIEENIIVEPFLWAVFVRLAAKESLIVKLIQSCFDSCFTSIIIL